MREVWKKKMTHLEERGPGQSPALRAFVLCLIQAFVLTQPALSLDFQTFQAYTIPVSNRGDARGGTDNRFDAERSVRRFQERARQEKEARKRSEEQGLEAQQARDVEQNVIHGQRVSQAVSQQEQREADFIYDRTTGLDNYSVDKEGGVWRSHLGLLAEAWNLLSRDLFGNESRSHLKEFTYNHLLNPTGMKRQTADQAGRMTETVISNITYQKGETLRNYLSKNREAGRTEITTTYHPTGNQVVRTEIFDLQYDHDGRDAKLIAQKAKVTDLSGPTPDHTLLQETFNMKYDGDNVTSSETRVTDLATGAVTDTITKNQFSGNRLTSGVTESTIKDPIHHTVTKQIFTQNVSYAGHQVQSVDAKGLSTTQAMDEGGNPVSDFIQTTETAQTMGVFFGIPNVTESVSVSKLVDNVGVQTTESTQTQKYIRDEHGNLLNVVGTESARTVNADSSIVQTTEGILEFSVVADQPYLVGREDQSFIKDHVGGQDVTTESRLRIRLGALGEILEGIRTGTTHSVSHDGIVVSDSEFTQYFDRAVKINELGLVRQETSTRSANAVEESTSTERRIYEQTHDDVNRVLSAKETIDGVTTSLKEETRLSGTVDYAVGKRTNQVHASSSTYRFTTKDHVNNLYTESVQTSTFEADENTGRALQGTGITESFSQRMLDDGSLLDAFVIRSRVEETLVGLLKANGFGMTARTTRTEIREISDHRVTDREEVLVQKISDVGKVEGASSITRSVTQDLGRTGVFKTVGLTQTDYQIVRNSPIPTETKSVEVTVNHVDSSYRVVARHDVTRYDSVGRILPIDKKRPEASGHQMFFYHDVTLQTIPGRLPSPEQLFQRFFGSGPRG